MIKTLAGVCLLSAVAAAPLAGSAATVYLKADFQNGKLPKTMTAADLDGLTVAAAMYRHGATDQGWKVENAGSKGYAAVSPTLASSNPGNLPQLNVLGTSAMTIGPGAVARWTARSMMPGFAESYALVAVTADGAETTLWQTEAEEEWWVTHAVSLAAFEGTDITLEWRATSTRGYLLAIDDIWVGEDDAPRLVLTDMTRRTQRVGEAAARGSVLNTGSGAVITALSAVVGGETVDRMEMTGTWLPGESRAFSLELPSALNETTEYMIVAETEGDDIVLVDNGRVWCSHYERRRLLDLGTGLWCNNCPEGHLEVEMLEREFPGQVIAVEIHANPDPLQVPEYWSHMSYYSVPTWMLDRDQDTKASKRGTVAAHIPAETVARLDATGMAVADRTCTVSVEVETAERLDNSSDRYRIGWIEVQDIDQSNVPEGVALRQENNANMAQSEQYYFLPSTLPPTLVKMHNVVRGCEGAFDGKPGSLPATLVPGQVYAADLEVTMPSAVNDMSAAKLVLLLLDTWSQTVMNADIISVADAAGAGIEAPVAAAARLRAYGGCIEVEPADPEGEWTLETYDLTGRMTARATGAGAAAVRAEAKGLTVARLTERGQVTTAKLVL